MRQKGKAVDCPRRTRLTKGEDLLKRRKTVSRDEEVRGAFKEIKEGQDSVFCIRPALASTHLLPPVIVGDKMARAGCHHGAGVAGRSLTPGRGTRPRRSPWAREADREANPSNRDQLDSGHHWRCLAGGAPALSVLAASSPSPANKLATPRGIGHTMPTPRVTLYKGVETCQKVAPTWEGRGRTKLCFPCGCLEPEPTARCCRSGAKRWPTLCCYDYLPSLAVGSSHQRSNQRSSSGERGELTAVEMPLCPQRPYPLQQVSGSLSRDNACLSFGADDGGLGATLGPRSPCKTQTNAPCGRGHLRGLVFGHQRR